MWFVCIDPWHVDGGVETTEYVHALTGATVELLCTVAASRREAVEWRRDGLDVTESSNGRFQLRSADQLDIVDVQLDDSGQYSCHVARNTFGDVQSQRFVVQVIGMN